jgi:hypothetical protein
VLNNTSSEAVELWHSDSWGAAFATRCTAETTGSVCEQLEGAVFALADVTGDGKPEILCTRDFMGAEGTRAQVWTGQGGYIHELLDAGGGMRIVASEVGLPIIEVHKVMYDQSSILRYRWSGSEFAIVPGE